MDETTKLSKAKIKRRTLLRALFSTTLAAVVAPVLYVLGRYVGYQSKGAGATDVEVPFDTVNAQNPSKLLDINDIPVLLIYQQDKGLRAFDAVCTHLGCTVSYQPEVPGFYCKCHHGRYDANGVNVPGTRPKSPLTELTIKQNGDMLDVTLIPKAKS